MQSTTVSPDVLDDMLQRDFNAYLTVTDSSLPQAGLGLFSRVPFEAGQLVGEYHGRNMNQQELDLIYGAGDDTLATHTVAFNSHYIDADPDTCLVARINHIFYLNLITCPETCSNNCEFQQVTDGTRRRLFVVTTKQVNAGEEFFVPYGDEYWDVDKQDRVKLLLDAIWAAGVIWHNFDMNFVRMAHLHHPRLKEVYAHLYDGKRFDQGHSGSFASLSSLLSKAAKRHNNNPLSSGRGPARMNLHYRPYNLKLIKKFLPGALRRQLAQLNVTGVN